MTVLTSLDARRSRLDRRRAATRTARSSGWPTLARDAGLDGDRLLGQRSRRRPRGVAGRLLRRPRRPPGRRRSRRPEARHDPARGARRRRLDPRHRPPDHRRRGSRRRAARDRGDALVDMGARGLSARDRTGRSSMSWLNRVRNGIPFLPKRQSADNLWHKCAKCDAMVFTKEWEENLFVCPRCDHHDRIGPEARFELLFDRGQYDAARQPRGARGPAQVPRHQALHRPHQGGARQDRRARRPDQRARQDRAASTAVVGVQDFAFMGGSMGMAVGAAFVAGVRAAIEDKCPYILFTAAGGARMQEGILSLMQMPRDDRRARRAEGSRPALYRRADRPDHRRRHRLLCDARRRPDRRARRADRLRRPAGDRTDDPREAARRLPARRISARARHDRHGRPPPRAARTASRG